MKKSTRVTFKGFSRPAALLIAVFALMVSVFATTMSDTSYAAGDPGGGGKACGGYTFLGSKPIGPGPISVVRLYRKGTTDYCATTAHTDPYWGKKFWTEVDVHDDVTGQDPHDQDYYLYYADVYFYSPVGTCLLVRGEITYSGTDYSNFFIYPSGCMQP